jgi:hypothetical protein
MSVFNEEELVKRLAALEEQLDAYLRTRASLTSASADVCKAQQNVEQWARQAQHEGALLGYAFQLLLDDGGKDVFIALGHTTLTGNYAVSGYVDVQDARVAGPIALAWDDHPYEDDRYELSEAPPQDVTHVEDPRD